MPSRLFSRSLPFPGGVACLGLALGLGLAAAMTAPAQSPSPAASPGGFRLYDSASPTPAPVVPATPPPSDYQPPKVLKAGRVTYPILASLNRIEGVVGVRFTIDEVGKVKDATVFRTSRSIMLDSVVKSRGMMEWTFQPATLAGKPIPSTLERELEFKLDPAEQRQLAVKRLAAPVGTPEPPYPAEALAIQPRPRGECTIGVFWTPAGLVDNINLLKSSGSASLDHAALRFAYENWHVDPKDIKAKGKPVGALDPKEFKEQDQFTKVVKFVPPDDGNSSGTPPPLSDAGATPAATPTPKPTATPRRRSN